MLSVYADWPPKWYVGCVVGMFGFRGRRIGLPNRSGIPRSTGTSSCGSCWKSWTSTVDGLTVWPVADRCSVSEKTP